MTLTVGSRRFGYLERTAVIEIQEHHLGSGVALDRQREAFAGIYRHLSNEVPMATQRHGQIVETATEARQAEPGPSVLALLTASTGLAVLVLGIIWFAFFRT